MTRAPRATYRLQLHAGFTLHDAAKLVPHLASLGFSHVYCSPILRARAGSTHGYDVVDHGSVNPELGGEASFEDLCRALAAHGMEQIVDLVPNHVGIGMGENTRWLDVLEYGLASAYASFFDIDWTPAKRELHGKVLLPILGDHYGRVLERGELRLEFDGSQGCFALRYYEHRLPIAPQRHARLLGACAAELRESDPADAETALAIERLAAEFAALPSARAPRSQRVTLRPRAEQAKLRLAEAVRSQPAVRAALQAFAERLCGRAEDPRSFRRLHALLEAQHYRLAYWSVAADEINYRRFFNINDLAALRVERPEVFEDVHRLVFRWIDEGKVSGLRIDHIDGLFDPRGYCERLAEHCAPRGTYIVVEKILATHERLRREWPVAGTTGYEFLNLLNGLFVDPASEAELGRIYERFLGRPADFDDILYACKKHVLNFLLAGELQTLSHEVDRLSEADWRTRDFTGNALREALKEAIACFPVYRSYVDARGATVEDRRDIDWALSHARRRSSDPEESLFSWLHAVLTTDICGPSTGPGWRRRVTHAVGRFQQLTSPVMAKALEDTSFYRFHRLTSLNEVGGDPRCFGTSLAAFHRANLERQRDWPNSMLASSTHDTKRGEDVRVRIDALSELPAEWGERVERWALLNRASRSELEGGPAPAPNEEYLLYQTLLGVWPMDGASDPDLAQRVQAYMVKAVRESKDRSSWRRPVAEYEAALSAFVERILDPVRSAHFLADFLPFQQRIARLGALNSLSQCLLKLTVPGVPDTYQGTELWDLSLADPDNRRPVDHATRARLLAQIRDRMDARSGPCDPGWLFEEGLVAGLPKLFVIARLLELRRRDPALFQEGEYRPLEVSGKRAEHVCAFARIRGEDCLVVVAPRCYARLLGSKESLPPEAAGWDDTAVHLNLPVGATRLRDVFTRRDASASARGDTSALPLRSLLAEFPVAALVASSHPHGRS